MCQRLTLLAQRDTMRYLAHCEHGTLHLRWRRTSVQLTRLEFNGMAQFLTMWLLTESAAESDSCVSLFRDSSGMIQLWIVGVGLYLTRDDLLLLIELINEVVHPPNTLSLEPASADQHFRDASQYRELHVAPHDICFAN